MLCARKPWVFSSLLRSTTLPLLFFQRWFLLRRMFSRDRHFLGLLPPVPWPVYCFPALFDCGRESCMICCLASRGQVLSAAIDTDAPALFNVEKLDHTPGYRSLRQRRERSHSAECVAFRTLTKDAGKGEPPTAASGLFLNRVGAVLAGVSNPGGRGSATDGFVASIFRLSIYRWSVQ